ncbi:MAG: hypothetical protein HOV80_38510 [Polyangiaceae bacterium]|nr:hypothetical protein [Polyangiaceae bacterium]
MRTTGLLLGAWTVFCFSFAASSCDSSSSDDKDDGETEETETNPDPSGCSQSQFACGSGECISSTYVCDGPAQCADGSDEAPVNTECGTPATCTTTEFACSPTQCIHLLQYCNDVHDCDNGADETEACATCALPDTTAPIDCESACGDVYDCGLRICSGALLCPGFNGTPEERTVVVAACLDICMMTPGLITGIDPGNCTNTVDLAKTISSDFEFACESGVGG